MDNIRLYMWIKMVLHPIHAEEDLDYQKTYLEDTQQFKQLTEQLHGFGAFALYPLLGYEAINWHLDPVKENPLFCRLAAVTVCRRYPHTAEVVEDLLIHTPDLASANYFTKNSRDFAAPVNYRLRYAFNLYRILSIISTTSRNDWWPGTSPDIREWAESALARLPKAYKNLIPGFLDLSGQTSQPPK